MSKTPSTLNSDAPTDLERRRLLRAAGLGGGMLALGACATPGGFGGFGALGGRAAAAPGVAAGADAKSRKAMAKLNALIARISAEYLSPARGVTTALDIAEGQRYILHLLSAANAFYMEGDPVRARFVDMVPPTRKLLGDNPDAKYFFTLIDSNRYYRIRGRRKGNEYISYTVHADKGRGNWNGVGISHVNHRDIRFERDGRYEIIVGPTRRGSNPLLTKVGGKKAAHIVNRHYYEHERNAAGDPSVRPELSIETLEPVPGPSPNPSDEEIAERLGAVANFLKVATLDMPPPSPRTAPSWFSTTPNEIGIPHTFGDNQDNVGFGALDNTYAAGIYALQPGQALVMEGRMPACFFANVVLWNRFMQTGDYLSRQVSLNRQQMQLDRNGRYRIVVADQNPGVANWLDTTGHAGGTVFWRFLLADGRVERPKTSVTTVAELRAAP